MDTSTHISWGGGGEGEGGPAKGNVHHCKTLKVKRVEGEKDLHREPYLIFLYSSAAFKVKFESTGHSTLYRKIHQSQTIPF